MNSNADPEGSTGWVSRRTTIATLVGGASVGVQVLVPLIWPKLDRAVGLTLLLLCLVGLAVAGILLVRRPKHAVEPARRWSVIGIGQGWVETRVRNNAGDQLVIASRAIRAPKLIRLAS